LKVKKSYEKASGEAETAFGIFQKADQDMSKTKLEVEKVRQSNNIVTSFTIII